MVTTTLSRSILGRYNNFMDVKMTNDKQPTDQLLESTCGSSKQRKFREFWILWKSGYKNQATVTVEKPKEYNDSLTNVVEIGALKAAQDEIEQLKSENYEIRCQRQSWMNRIDEATYTENSCLEQLKNIKEQNEQLKSEIEVLKYDNEQLTTKLSYFENGEN